MNRRQKEVIQYQLDSEKEVLEQLTKQYQKALDDIDRKIRILQSDELTQSRVYRIEYQKALKMQVEGILEKLHSDEYTTIQQFLSHSYTDAFVGTVYDMFGQGVPFIMPIDNNAAVKAVITDSKISEGLYERLGVDTKTLKNSIRSEITRGIAAGLPHSDIARNIASYAKAPLGRAKTIVRTEAHRIQQASKHDAQNMAKSRGADVVKQWDATLDGDTRKSHRKLDGQIRELDEYFEMDGKKARYPGDFGDPAEDCNCRCQLLQRSRVALDEDELKTLQERAEFFGLDKTADFEEFKKKYLQAAEWVKSDVYPVSLGSLATTNFQELDKYMTDTYGIKITSKAQSLDFESVRDAVSGVEWTMQQFPKIQGYLKKIDSNKKGGVMNCTGNTIACSPSAFDGYYYKGKHDFFRSTGVHEAAHMAEGFMIDQITSGAREFAEKWNNHHVAKEIVKEAISRLPKEITEGKKYWEIYETISPDAGINASECVAEAIADIYKHGEKASQLAKEIFAIMKARIG